MADAGRADAARDAPLGDVSSGADAPNADAPRSDAPGSDAPPTPEVCSGGVDEDDDRATDCDDSDCWAEPTCIDADVARVVPGLVRCGAPVVLDAAATSADCAAIGTPEPGEIPTECDAATVTTTILGYCDGEGASAALWIEERAATPRTSTMITPRLFRSTSYERVSILDWERHVSGPGSTTGSGPIPIHDGRDFGTGGMDQFRTITVRAVAPGDGISRLLGFSAITSMIDVESGTSDDTRRSLRTGGLEFSVPRP